MRSAMELSPRLVSLVQHDVRALGVGEASLEGVRLRTAFNRAVSSSITGLPSLLFIIPSRCSNSSIAGLPCLLVESPRKPLK